MMWRRKSHFYWKSFFFALTDDYKDNSEQTAECEYDLKTKRGGKYSDLMTITYHLSSLLV